MKKYPSFTKRINPVSLLIPAFIFISGILNAQNNKSNEEQAMQYFKSVYVEDSGQLEKLISDNIVVTYPVFQEIFNKVGFSGKEEVIQFANHFKQKWYERSVKFRDVITEENKVVLIWTCTGKQVAENPTNTDDAQKQTWGGITVIYFNDSGKINAEFGLENDTGPFELLQQTRDLN